MRNQTYEQYLNEQHVEWKYLERLQLNAIDMKRSLSNQARIEEAVIPSLINQYRERLKAGDEFPPVVVHRPARKFLLLDGIQRVHACQPAPGWKGKEFFDAYLVINTDNQVINRIAWGINNRVNGRRLSDLEAMKHAITFVRAYEWTCKDAAAEFGIVERHLLRAVHIEGMKDRLHEQGLNRLPADEMIERLSHLASLGDDVFANAARVIVETGSSYTDIDTLVKAVKRARTHADKLAVIGQYESSDHAQARRAETKGGTVRPRSPMPRERLRRSLTMVRNLLEDQRVKSVLLPSSADKKAMVEAHDLAADVVRLLARLYGPSVLAVNQEGATA